MPKKTQIDGFDYRIQKPVRRSRKEWIADLTAMVKAGGKRRVEEGETFAHQQVEVVINDKKTTELQLAWECYAPLPKVT